MTAPVDPLHVRAGVEDLEALHEKRRALWPEYAKLEAKYGDWRHAEAQRKVVLAYCEIEARKNSPTKMTDKAADAAAHSAARYTNHLNDAEGARERLKMLENDLQDINDRIKARSDELHFVRAEMSLR